MLLLKYVTLIIFKFGEDILMKKELKRFTFKPVELQYLDDNDGFFYAHLQDSVNELCQILDLKKKPYIYISPRSINLYDGTRGLHIGKKYTPSMIFVRFDEVYATMFFTLAHEMYHEYQWRTSSKSFTEETRDKREIEANAFALAYCRLLDNCCVNPQEHYYSYSYPEKFSPDVYTLSDQYAEKFDLPKSSQAE